MQHASILGLIPNYLKRRAEDVVLLQRGVKDLDYSAIRSIAHKLCGNGGTFGFDRISRIGALLEAAALEHDIAGVRESIFELDEYLISLQTA